VRNIDKAELTAFKLIFSRNELEKIVVEKTGKIRVDNNIIRLDYGINADEIGWIGDSSLIIRTLQQNVLPMYMRVVGSEVWLSNDVSELLIQGEVVSVRLADLLLSAAGSDGIRTVLSHLIEDIIILMPISRYRISFEDGSPLITWSDIDFEFHENATKEDFLDFLIEQYNKAYYEDLEICLGISGGWDSRLELAILNHLKKKIHCYHYIISNREAKQARLAAHIAGVSFHEFPSGQLILPGWDFLKQQGYLTRWDGFFAPGALYSAGLYIEIKKEYPHNAIRMMSSSTGWKGSPYEHSQVLLRYWLDKEERYFNRSYLIFPEYSSLLMQELKRRQEIVSGLIPQIWAKCERKDIAVDISYIILSGSKIDARETFLFENGMPIFDGAKKAIDFFISLPEKDKKQTAFPEWAIGKLNPKLKKLPHTTSAMNRAEREFGRIGRIRLLHGFLGRFSKIDRDYNQDWFQDPDVVDIFKLIPEIKHISERVSGDKLRLYTAQICRFLKAIQEKKNVTFRIVE
jgi:hypothetical protein